DRRQVDARLAGRQHQSDSVQGVRHERCDGVTGLDAEGAKPVHDAMRLCSDFAVAVFAVINIDHSRAFRLCFCNIPETKLGHFVDPAGMKLTCISLMPLMKLDRSRRGGEISSTRSTRSVSARNSCSISSLARWRPRQKCGPPPPKPRCGLGSRVMSNVSGSSNTDSSRLAEV